jgi:hypothetical protein
VPLLSEFLLHLLALLFALFGQLSSLLVLSSICISALSLSNPIFCFLYFSYLIYWFIYLSINFFFPILSIYFICMFFLCLPVLHMVVASLSQAILPRSTTELLGFLPPSHCINPTGRQHAYWETITAQAFPHINCGPKCDSLSSWISWPMNAGQIGCPKMLVRN